MGIFDSIGGGGSGSGLIGGALSSGLSFLAAKQARDFVEKMTRHRYQYQMEDMRLAGLNPILSYSQAPPGGPGSGMAQIADMAGSMAKGAAAGESSARTTKVADERKLITQQTVTSAAQADAANASASNSRADALLKGLDVPKAKRRADLYTSEHGPNLTYGQEGGSAFGLGGRVRAFGKDVLENMGRKMNKALKDTRHLYDKSPNWNVR